MNSTIYNDPILTFAAEKKILDLVRRDKSFEKDSINAITLINGEVVNLLVIFKENRGRLMGSS